MAGESRDDRRQWNTYVSWSRGAFAEPIDKALKIAYQQSCMPESVQASLRAIVFTTFALEYRLRSVYDALGLEYRRRDGIWDLASNLEARSRNALGVDGKLVRFPAEWRRILTRIQHLIESRNAIAHGNSMKVRGLVTGRAPSLKVRARRDYNAFVDAVRVINVAVGYEKLRGVELRNYYAALKVRRG